MLADKEKDLLHEELEKLTAAGANWQRIMVAHALVELGATTAIECAMPTCLKPTRKFDYSNRATALSIDHITTLSTGGSHRPTNLRLAHLGCNSAAARMSDEGKLSVAESMRLMRRRQRYKKAMEQIVKVENDATEGPDRQLEDLVTDWSWLGSTRTLQSSTYKLDYETLHGEKLADYLIWNHLALIDELHEFFQEVKWKNWAKDRGRIDDRDAAVDELIDVGHFYANMLAALGVSDEEWTFRYQEKQRRNARRQAIPGGYDTTTKKCSFCHRELDKPMSMYWRSGEAVGAESVLYCAKCDTKIENLPAGWQSEFAVERSFDA